MGQCASQLVSGGAVGAIPIDRLLSQFANGGKGNPSPTPSQVRQAAQDAIKADVYMFSGCKDEQTSADVGNVSTFGLPPSSGPGGAGGACTNALLAQAYEDGSESWLKVLGDMVGFLSRKGYTQRPQLSTSKPMDLNQPFRIIPDGHRGRKIALLVGINYATHTQGRLNGCVNDVVSMKTYLRRLGFQENEEDMKIIVDVPSDHISISTSFPKKAEILRGIQWLASQAKPGDVLFFHYSGHGAQIQDTSGDEEDGKDEVLVPEDYRKAGMITDDELYIRLVSALPAGVRLVCVMDCCHSGTILDLPYVFKATGESIHQAQVNPASAVTSFNPAFNAIMKKVLIMGAGYLMKQYPGIPAQALSLLQSALQ